MPEFLMPKLGADMTEGLLVVWHKQPGDPVQRGEVIAEVETEKGAIGVESYVTGVLERTLVKPGQTLPVGAPMAIIRTGTEAEPPPAHPTVAAPVQPSPQPTASSPPTAPARSQPRASPAARKLARELGVDLEKVKGTGPAGAVTREDIERAAATAKQPATLDRATRLRQTIAAAMSRSKREIPHYYLSTTIDLQRATAWLADQNQTRSLPDRLLPGVLLLKAAALTLRQVPELNSVWDGEKVVLQEAVHLGVAISLRQGGLIAPAIHHADQLSLPELMAKLRDLVSRARAGSLRSSELADPTITVTSLGEQGVDAVFPIIYPPQVAIVGFGKIVDRPWAVSGQIVVRPVVTATLAADHRVSDGHRGGLYLAAVERLLQEPEKL
ncbi:MAG TPA: dihydrolipoamide acetyltransferase family protein [Gemmatales bacterium]|nr:dihydrolipoamide acetyltransferase family protein [Gemmatales bacterium]HMP59097.1 dihydrolipoamide acetyltransferase family protein [Gemmatales bacterium]